MTDDIIYSATSLPTGEVTMKLKCQRCGNEWEYKGKNEYYAPCSKCKTSVSLKKKASA
jgi:tRNA(Ile2) C34 agmatinyltransferase TiaS